MSADPAAMRPSTVEIEISKQAVEWTLSDEETVLRAARAAFEAVAANGMGACGISILLADDAFVQTLNRKYRSKDKPTNVLSFPQTTPPGGLPKGESDPLGDIALARETLTREADEQRKSLEAHLAHLTVHGVLHLLGFDHEETADAEEMEDRERAILKGLGFADPYLADSGLADNGSAG